MTRWAQRLDDGIAKLNSAARAFRDGWGDADEIAAMVSFARDMPQPAPITITWTHNRRLRGGGYLFEGFFPSPFRQIPLPAAARTAYVQMLLPREPFAPSPAAVALHLAGSGDTGFLGRRILAQPLLKQGIGAMILQNPFYGSRKPPGQTGATLRRVSDQVAMNLATVAEAHALLRWIASEGFTPGVTGYSMGGFMSALVSQGAPYPLVSVPAATGDSPSWPLVRSPLSQMIAWDVLADHIGVRQDEAREHLAALLDIFRLSEHGVPVDPSLAIIVGTRHDVFIPPAETERLHEHWRGSELRWIEASHTTGWALHTGAYRSALRDAFVRKLARDRPARHLAS